jgi:hypothetical protein
MKNFEVTDAMLDAAEQAYDTIAAIEHDAWCYIAPTRAAIEAAINASGLVEENARLQHAVKVADSALSNALFVIRKQGVMPNGSWENGFISDQKVIRAALNEEPTP